MASCMPRIPATCSSSALTVGSSWYTSSPTIAPAIASRIPAVGFVIVSLLRSIIRESLCFFEISGRYAISADVCALGAFVGLLRVEEGT